MIKPLQQNGSDTKRLEVQLASRKTQKLESSLGDANRSDWKETPDAPRGLSGVFFVPDAEVAQ